MQETTTLDQRIRDMIDNLPENHTFTSFEETLFSKYTDCVDIEVNTLLYQEMWAYLKREIKTLDPAYFLLSIEKNPINILHTNLGAGKAIEEIPDHVFVESYNNNYYCHVVAQAVHRKKIEGGNFLPVFGDIADYFILEGIGHTRKYDIVISQPFADTSYHKIDADKMYASLDSYHYYTFKPTFYLKSGGYLCVFLPEEMARKIKSKERDCNKLCDADSKIERIITIKNSNFSILVIKKH